MKDGLYAIGAILLLIGVIVIMYFCPTIRLIMWVLIILAWLGLL